MSTVRGFVRPRSARRGRLLAPLAALLAVGVISSTSCKRETPAPTLAAPAPPAVEPLDRLLPGELAEGRDTALGLTLPRDMRVLRSFGTSVVARGRVGSEPLTDYIRRRVSASAAQMSAERISFGVVHVNGTPPGRLVKIDLVRDGEATMLFIDDATPPEITPGLSDDERWKRAGVNPRNPLDPTQL